MKFFVVLFFTTFLSGVSIKAEGKICLSLDRQIVPIEDFVDEGEKGFSKDGRYFLYEKKKNLESTSLIFLDLETEKKREFLSRSVLDTDEKDDWEYLYKTSRDESSLLGFVKGDTKIKVWSLPDFKETIIPITEGRTPLQISFLADGRVVIVEAKKDMMEIFSPIHKEVTRIIDGHMEETASSHVFDYYNEAYSSSYFIRVVDPLTLEQSERLFYNSYLPFSCAALDLRLNRLLQVREDGSIIATPFAEGDPVEIFSSVNGFVMGSNLLKLESIAIF